jgi:hypothetical protein
VFFVAVLTREFLQSGRTCHGNGSIVRRTGVSGMLCVLNLNNSEIRSHTLPTQHSAPAVKQKLRNDAECSHCAPSG